MALLDRFRTHAAHKHPDAAVRLAFVQEIPLDERDLLGEIAREDADPRVRRAAVAKVMDPAVARRRGQRRCGRDRAGAGAVDAARHRARGVRRARRGGEPRRGRRHRRPQDAHRHRQARLARGDGARRAGRRDRRPRARLDRAPRGARGRAAARRSTRCRITPSCSASPSTASSRIRRWPPSIASPIARSSIRSRRGRRTRAPRSGRARSCARWTSAPRPRNRPRATPPTPPRHRPPRSPRCPIPSRRRRPLPPPPSSGPRRRARTPRARTPTVRLVMRARPRRARAWICASASNGFRASARSTSWRSPPPSGKGCPRSTIRSCTTSCRGASNARPAPARSVMPSGATSSGAGPGSRSWPARRRTPRRSRIWPPRASSSPPSAVNGTTWAPA